MITRTRRHTAVVLGAAVVLVAGLTSLQTSGAPARASGHTDVLPYEDPASYHPLYPFGCGLRTK